MCLAEKYMRNTNTLEEAWQNAFNDKTHPIDGYDSYDQTAAEHYLWARYQTQQSLVLGATMPIASYAYTGLKVIAPLSTAGKPSWDEAGSGYWGFVDQLNNYRLGCGCK
jgi:hypothetical protein